MRGVTRGRWVANGVACMGLVHDLATILAYSTDTIWLRHPFVTIAYLYSLWRVRRLASADCLTEVLAMTQVIPLMDTETVVFD